MNNPHIYNHCSILQLVIIICLLHNWLATSRLYRDGYKMCSYLFPHTVLCSCFDMFYFYCKEKKLYSMSFSWTLSCLLIILNFYNYNSYIGKISEEKLMQMGLCFVLLFPQYLNCICIPDLLIYLSSTLIWLIPE